MTRQACTCEWWIDDIRKNTMTLESVFTISDDTSYITGAFETEIKQCRNSTGWEGQFWFKEISCKEGSSTQRSSTPVGSTFICGFPSISLFSNIVPFSFYNKMVSFLTSLSLKLSLSLYLLSISDWFDFIQQFNKRGTQEDN